MAVKSVTKKMMTRSGHLFRFRAAMAPRMMPKMSATRMALPDGGGDVTPRLQGNTKVSVEYVFEIVEELLADRLVEAVAFIQYLHDCGRLRFFSVERSAGDRVHGKERDEADEEQGNERQCDTLDEIFSQKYSLPFFTKSFMLLHYIIYIIYNQSLTFDEKRGRSGDSPLFSLSFPDKCANN